MNPLRLTDIVLRNARVIDPSQNINTVLDIAFHDGTIVGLGPNLSASPGGDEIDLTGGTSLEKAAPRDFDDDVQLGSVGLFAIQSCLRPSAAAIAATSARAPSQSSY